ncbi:MAG: FAD-dependent oxidoreductase [Alphaproteobacteria bacterium]|nr:FAD-dependent oxidoreductase [Alphaproteobacteria bacterium]
MRPNRDDRVLIVGAGPAGLMTAIALRDLGYTHVTVVEKEDGVGGKCRSFVYDGIAYDLGANLTTPRYTTIRPLAAKLGLRMRSLPERRVVNLGEENVPTFTDAAPWEKLALRAAGAYYVGLRKRSGIERDGLHDLPDAVKLPFREWLAKYGLSPFREIFANLFIAYGYGVMDDLPAAYALKFFDRVHLFTAIETIIGENKRTTKVFDDGFQALWERVVEHWHLDVRLGAEITEITRSPNGVQIVYDSADGGVREDFDVLVLACPLDASLGFMDVTDAERRLFQQIQYYDYYVTAARLRDVPDISTFLYPYSRKFTPGWPTIFYPPVPEDPHDVFVFYSYGDEETTVDKVRANLRTVIGHPKFAGELEEFLVTHHWRYFPHVATDAMQAGFYDDLDELQGRWRTFYTGELLSFPLVELVARNSQTLVDRFFR